MGKAGGLPHVGSKLWGVKQESFNDETHSMIVTANSGQVDRMGEVLPAGKCDYGEYELNPVFLWAHDDMQFPIGKAARVWTEKDELLAEIQFAVNEYERAATAWRLYRGGYLNAVSVRFMAEWGSWEDFEETSDEFHDQGLLRRYGPWTLLEISSVNIPCDAMALRKALADGPDQLCGILGSARVTPKAQPALDESKGAVPFKDWPLADEDTPWSFSAADGNAIVEDHGWTAYRDCHNWQDPDMETEVRARYKLPCAKIVGGSIKVVWRGVAAAMARLLSSAGPDIPEADRKPVYNRLKRYYGKFDKPVPDFKQYGPIGAVQAAFGIEGTDALVEAIEPFVREGSVLELGADELLAILEGSYSGGSEAAPDAESRHLFGPEVDEALLETLGKLPGYLGSGEDTSTQTTD